MPLRALEATTVDYCLPGKRIGEVLSELVRQAPGAALPVPPDIRLEVQIAAGERIGSDKLVEIGDPAALSCPSCGGVLSRVRVGNHLRFRCQVGHAYAADALAKEQESKVDEALRVALRIIEERAELVQRMASAARQNGRLAIAENYEPRAAEYRKYADIIRRAVLDSMEAQPSKA
jgi:two-component system chemotaxis response regulator CheB